MLHKSSYSLVKSQLLNNPKEVLNIPTQSKSVKNFSESGFKRSLNRLSIRQKIYYGYALAIGVAVLGILPARFMETYYEHQAGRILIHTRQATTTIKNLESALLKAQSHQHFLPALLTTPEKFEYEYIKTLEKLDVASRLLNDVKQTINAAQVSHEKVFDEIEYQQLIKSIQPFP